MEVDWGEVIRVTGVVFGIFVVIGGVIYKFSCLTNNTDNNSKKIKEHDDLLDEHEMRIDEVCNDIPFLLTGSEHERLCLANTQMLCKKIDNMHSESKKFWKMLAAQVDKIERKSDDKFDKITEFMGEIKGRNEIIDSDRERRKSD